MTQITPSQDCGNSPKNILLQYLEIAFAGQNTAFLQQSLTHDVTLHIAGGQTVQGLEQVLALVQQAAETAPIAEHVIQHVVSHGKAGAVNGIRRRKDGKTYEFCSVFEFSNAKGIAVREITHYAIEQAG